ncbi:MAG: glycosyltransferase [Candidatus Peregrinibacteria bacterium]
MKVALVHELLTMKGGAEKVLRVLAAMFPEAPIYTLLYNEEKLGDWFPKERVRTSGLKSRWLPAPYRYNHHLFLKKFPAAVEAWDFSEFDLVISASSAFTHGIIANGKPRHLCYVHSPARYLWDRTHDVLERAGRGVLGKLRRKYLERTFHKLRIWDSEAADRPDTLIAASKEVQRRIELYWRRQSDVIYPPIDDFWFKEHPTPPAHRSLGEGGYPPPPTPYFFIASTLVPYKRIDVAIEACNLFKLPLKVAGTGPDERRLKSLAGPTVEMLGYVTDEELKSLYTGATATLFPGEEDFGLVPVESMACGTPVVALRKGGALETIVEGKTGAFFSELTAASLADVLRDFKKESFDPATCRAQAEKFSRQKFEEHVQSALKNLMNS